MAKLLTIAGITREQIHFFASWFKANPDVMMPPIDGKKAESTEEPES